MKLTKSKLKQIIKEELGGLREDDTPEGYMAHVGNAQNIVRALREELEEGPWRSSDEAEEGRQSMIVSFEKLNEILDSLADRLGGL